MKMLWRGSLYDGLAVLFLGWLYGVSIVKFDWIAWTLIGLGGVLVAASVGLNWNRFSQMVKERRTQVSLNALLVIVLVLGIVGMLDYLSIRHSWRVDTTSQREFSLSEQTVSILRNLDEDVSLTAFVSDAEIRQMGDRLTEYVHYSAKFKYDIIDPIKEPDRVREFFGPDKQYLDMPTLVLKTALKDEEIKSVDEENITNALIKVTRKEKRKVYFTQGHGEKTINPDQPGMDGYQFVREDLEKQHFDVEEINLYESEAVPVDADVLVVAGPARRLAKGEIDAVDKFLEDGGNVLAMIDPETESGTDSLLANWNVKLNRDMVIETHSSFVLTSQGLSRQSNVSVAPASAEYGEHMITKNFRFATSYIKAQSLTVIDEEDDSIETTPLVYTSGNSWGETNLDMLFDEGKVAQDEDDHEGPTTVAMAVEKDSGNKTRLVVMGDSDFASDVYVEQAPGNRDFFLNVVSWLAEEEDLISVRPKETENRPLTMTMRQQKLTLFFLIILLPLLAVRMGIHVYMKRS
ncbi:MAG: GldG family protein [Candidatus Marinimicrobia bacterium]|jgi:ABC-type uncharacterized transport system involved in gliding motility auxiliary subunit|nr:GldG family protein [Candidatus Neomarinimicrobiota bacterium]MDP6966128.1 GldG family protein [Candidatus Neomarinimicrobiota bacterium]|tara:strand:+ start:24938 stop:26494 length:1557 start_codon:yes stop_codon:yes gene_type:complete